MSDNDLKKPPTIGEFWELLKKYPNERVTLHGYIVSPGRDDYRITIEGLESFSRNNNFSIDLSKKIYWRYPNFVNKNYPGYQYCWYD